MEVAFQEPFAPGMPSFYLVTCQHDDCDHNTTQSAHHFVEWV